MKKIIKEYKTISSDDNSDFDNQVNSHLRNGWEVLENSYTMNIISKSDININVKVYKKKSDEYDIFSDHIDGYKSELFSQVLVYKDQSDCNLSFHDNGRLKIREVYKNGNLNGKFTTWYENGLKHEVGTYKDGNLNGKFTTWYEDGQKEQEETYKEGERNGKYTRWYENGLNIDKELTKMET